MSHAVIIGWLAILSPLASGFVMVWRKERAFRERFPPISDEEFLARCPPGTDPEIALKVRETLSDARGVDRERIYPESRLIADLGAE